MSKRILEKNFKQNTPFSFIQVGANDGISFDFLYDFVITRNSTGIVIEPVKDYFKELENNYSQFPGILTINKAVHPEKKQIELYKIKQESLSNYPDWVKGIASLDIHHHQKLQINSQDIILEKVAADNLMDIIRANYNQKIDYLQIDTEGFDYEVLKMLDFGISKPAIIKYEFVNLKPEDQLKTTNLLQSQGYYLFSELGDTIALDLNKIKL
ncbi:FkbM family methyltransferase [Flavobacterium crassostreae]|uniref:FkbM family methyltransferase n=1 Tax=Flavobacterium crassostreae TaxID=1763534 RepID=UPI0012FE1F4C|nr:FkbM family methyltransferase [Flavobacterium crassostreae]